MLMKYVNAKLCRSWIISLGPNICNLSTPVLVHPNFYRRLQYMPISVDKSLSMHNKIIIPPQLRALILEDLLSCHMGIDHKALEFIYNRGKSLSKASSAMVQRLKKTVRKKA